MTALDLTILRAEFEVAGFVVLREFLALAEVAALADEVERELGAAFGSALLETPTLRPIDGYYLPLLRPSAPVTCALVESERLVQLAETLVGDRVFVDPVSPGTVSFYGPAPWHRDADEDVPGVKFVSYLEALRAGAGAIHLSRGSQFAQPRTDGQFDDQHLRPEVEYVAELEPGDLLAFDLRTWHANPTPIRRTQWTATYLRRPRGDRELTSLLGWLAEGESYDIVEPLPNGLQWLDRDWVADPSPSATKAHWLAELASFGRLPASSGGAP